MSVTEGTWAWTGAVGFPPCVYETWTCMLSFFERKACCKTFNGLTADAARAAAAKAIEAGEV